MLFPFGWPSFNIVAAIPLIVFSVISMAEATGRIRSIRAGPMSEGTIVSELAVVRSVLDSRGFDSWQFN